MSLGISSSYYNNLSDLHYTHYKMYVLWQNNNLGTYVRVTMVAMFLVSSFNYATVMYYQFRLSLHLHGTNICSMIIKASRV